MSDHALRKALTAEVKRLRTEGTGLRDLGTKEKRDALLGAGSALLEEADRLQGLLDESCHGLELIEEE